MEFDRSKILTVVTVSQAKIGQKGWFGDTPIELETEFRTKKPYTLKELRENVLYPFETSVGLTALFYPAPEPTYEERQAEWVKENNVKEGTKVRITRTFTEDEDGSCCFAHNDLVGETGVVSNITAINLGINMDGGYFKAVPYFALEVIKEPTYRPFANADEYKPYREKWLKMRGIIFQINGYDNDGIIIDDDHFSWEKAFRSYKFDDGTPFGTKEEV